MPPGNIICTKNGKYYKWYQRNEHTYSYIPKKQKTLASQLALRKYLNSLLTDLNQEQHAIEFFSKNHSNKSNANELLNHPEFQSLLSSYFTPLSQDLSDWMHASYEHNPKHPEHLVHKSISGHLLRSKSEAIIDMLLYTNKIPFRYECALRLNEISLFPDFTIRHPKTGHIYYWEHFGLMDNPSYVKNTFSKLQLYSMHGIIPSIQLITTYETKANPLDVNLINKIIEHYFL